MGDFDWRYAETAAKITEQQMLLARKYGDPSILARCYLYSALADAQLGEMARAERMVRAIYYWATQVSPCFLVEKCAQGTFKKLVAMKKFGVKNGISGDDEK
ncbi:unnamed protein product [Caenorhabditis angaria]|uniref:Uncharacterized protein n=1 Tax=Caenorhabditis angaria TaxID=860376 RepID=A0A9P1IHH5_9PELO|nr:unnamed protein product [Caenorhabditis angaria]